MGNIQIKMISKNFYVVSLLENGDINIAGTNPDINTEFNITIPHDVVDVIGFESKIDKQCRKKSYEIIREIKRICENNTMFYHQQILKIEDVIEQWEEQNE